MKTLMALAVLAGCQLNTPLTPQAAEEATYKLFNDEGQGTGWAVDEHHMITAGHMCTSGVNAKLTARASTGLQFQATVVDYEMTDLETIDISNPPRPRDVCLLATERRLAAPLRLASTMPTPGTEAWFVGYPMGELVKSVGSYTGDIDGNVNWDNYTVSLPCDHGASGSALFTADGVFGVLVRVIVLNDQIRGGSEGCVATPIEDIKDLLKRNGLSG